MHSAVEEEEWREFHDEQLMTRLYAEANSFLCRMSLFSPFAMKKVEYRIWSEWSTRVNRHRKICSNFWISTVYLTLGNESIITQLYISYR